VKHLRATLLVGLLVVVSIVLVIVGVLHSNRGIGAEEDSYTVKAMFNDVTGIARGTKVTIAGYTVGQVDDVKLMGTQVRVKVRLRRMVRIFSGTVEPTGERRNGAVLTRLEASLLGDYYLALTPGAAGRELKQGDEIPTVVTATAMQATMQKLEVAANIVPKIDKIAGDVAKITNNAAAVLGNAEGAKRFETIADNLVAASANLSATTANLQKRLGEGVLGPDGDLDKGLRSFASVARKADGLADRAGSLLDTTGASAGRSLRHIEEVTKTVRDLVGRNTGGVEATVGTLTSTLRKVEDTLARIDRVVAHLEGTAQHIADGKGNVGRLLKDDTLVRDAETIVAESKALVQRYTQLETSIDYRLAAYSQKFRAQGLSLNGEAPLEWQSHVSLRLQPRKDMYVAATLTSDNLGKTKRRTLVTSSTTDGQPQSKLTEEFVESEADFKFGILYARRFGPLTIKGGLIESSAGGGLDLHLFQDRFAASVDLLRFAEANRPRLRLALAWDFYRHIYAWMGADDLLVAKRRDVFFGLGVSIQDDDLKILFASAPAVSTN